MSATRAATTASGSTTASAPNIETSTRTVATVVILAATRACSAAGDRTALATLYCALMTDLMLTRMGASSGDLIVEGSFAGNLPFCEILAALRPKQPLFAAEDAAGTARGAAMLAHWPPNYPIAKRRPVHKTSITGLESYRDVWTAAVELIAR